LSLEMKADTSVMCHHKIT